jgi:transposase InsO family protein
MKQAARELTSCDDGFLNDKRYLIMDRDTKFCESFRSILRQSDVQPVILLPKSPNLNSQLERYFGSLKYECLSRMIFFGKRSRQRPISLHHLHVTPKPCRVLWQRLRRHPDHHSRSLLAQFGLTPKSRRGLAAGEAGDALDAL